MRDVITFLLAIVVYVWLYAAYGVSTIIANAESTRAISMLKGMIAVSPPVVSIGYNSIDISRLSEHIFSIVIIYIIYIILLLTVACGIYTKIRWK